MAERRPSVPTIALALTAAAWLVLVLLAAAGMPMARAIALDLTMACVPLGLIALLWLLTGRPARRDAALDDTPQALRAIVAEIAGEREQLAEQMRLLGDVAKGAKREIGATALALGEETALIGLRAHELELAATATQAKLLGALAELPQSEARLRGLGDQLRELAAASDLGAERLKRELGRIAAGAREADAAVGEATQRLLGELGRIEVASGDAGRSVELIAASMARLGGDATERALRSIEAMRGAVEQQGVALDDAMARARATLDRAGADRLARVDETLDALGARLDGLAARVAGEAEAAESMIRSLDRSIAAIEQRLQSVGDATAERTADLAEALAALGERAEAVAGRIAKSADAAREPKRAATPRARTARPVAPDE